MSMDQETYEMLEEKFIGLAPANCVAIALRASLRALPLLMLHSSSDKQARVSIQPFGYWSDKEIRQNLLATLSSQGLAIRLLAPCSTDYVNVISPVFEQVERRLYKASDGLDFACRRAYSNEYLFSDTCGRAYTASTVCASAVIGSIYANLEATGFLQANVEAAAKKKVNIKAYAKEANDLHQQLIAAAAYATENNFAKEKATVTAFSINEARNLSARFNLRADTISHIIADTKTDALKELQEAAHAAEKAFQQVSESTVTSAGSEFIETFREALSAAARYEDIRVSMLPFGDDISTDFYVEPPQQSYSVLTTLLLAPSDLLIKINHCLESAAKIIEGFNGAIQAQEVRDFTSVFDDYDAAYREFDSFTGFALQPERSELSSALAALYHFSNPTKLNDIRKADIETYDANIVHRAIDAIGYMLSGCQADVDAYSKYDTYTIRELSLDAVLSDLEFLDRHSIHELFVRRLWSPPSPTHAADERPAIHSLYPGATRLWQFLWNDFKRDALAIDPDLHPWLDWYDGLFTRGAMDIPVLEALIETAYPQQHEVTEPTDCA